MKSAQLIGDGHEASPSPPPTSNELSSTEVDEEKDRRRLDTEPDLLEEFLENEGKILRLPTGGDFDIDLDDLAKVINPDRFAKHFLEEITH